MWQAKQYPSSPFPFAEWLQSHGLKTRFDGPVAADRSPGTLTGRSMQAAFRGTAYIRLGRNCRLSLGANPFWRIIAASNGAVAVGNRNRRMARRLSTPIHHDGGKRGQTRRRHSRGHGEAPFSKKGFSSTHPPPKARPPFRKVLAQIERVVVCVGCVCINSCCQNWSLSTRDSNPMSPIRVMKQGDAFP
jgi:hypothetical protein